MVCSVPVVRHPSDYPIVTSPFLPHSLAELVQDGVNGLVFHDAEQLAAQFEVRSSVQRCQAVTYRHLFASVPSGDGDVAQTLLESHPSSAPLNALRASLQSDSWGSWAHNWDRVIRPLVLADASGDIQVEG